MENTQQKPDTRHYVKGPEGTELHTVDIWTSSAASTAKEGKVWVIFIHGGAWRDPEVDSKAFRPAISVLESSKSMSAIAGFASINYRLSPYPTNARNPSKPGDLSRNVHHPEHLLDVGHALQYLDEHYGIANNYVLVGHSAGAALAFQLHQSYFPEPLPHPSCVLGIAGIYDFEAFVEAHKEISACQEIMENAFPARSTWEQASPNKSQLPGLALWEQAKTVVISYSNQDELVENGQASLMLERASTISKAAERVHELKTSGKHDEIWQGGSILAALIEQSLGWLRS
ncbi:hypothetical protein G7Y89_g5580 [Cudoniella acicularis]|uniref:BD-FAE-like domain-containing protein n=1 Tax=Cudoniella acicularis TaxID=354080 RepID=A0A8H4W5L2_9HELO|nr:hypothetical protein G7Y89_g5580 [Cudoniella acicularis]